MSEKIKNNNKKEQIAKNTNLHKAKNKKNDEFYTLLSDIENELKHYKPHFKWKIVYCNCDDPQESNFFKYFALNFTHLWLKKLITTHYNRDGWSSYQLIVEKDINKDWIIDMNDTIKIPLKWNGDFRSEESIKLLKEADIIVTNPPFSLFREYVKQLIDYNKKFLIIWNKNSITYKEIFLHIKNNTIWLWFTSPKEFIQPDGNKTKKISGLTRWYTNLEHDKRNEELILYMKYKWNEDHYPKYENYDAIEVSKVKEIPKDYKWVMGVPITFLDKYNPKQFEILGAEEFEEIEVKKNIYQKPTHKLKNWKTVYKRLWIKNKTLK